MPVPLPLVRVRLRSSGFSLVELLLALVLLMTLGALLVAGVRHSQSKAYTVAMMNDLRAYVYAHESGSFSSVMEAEDAGAFGRSPDVVVLEEDLHPEHWYLRLGHNRTPVSCWLHMTHLAEADEANNRIICDEEWTPDTGSFAFNFSGIYGSSWLTDAGYAFHLTFVLPDEAGALGAYEFDLGAPDDGVGIWSITEGPGSVSIHAYYWNPGSYPVTVTAWDSSGEAYEGVRMVEVLPLEPVHNHTVVKLSGDNQVLPQGFQSMSFWIQALNEAGVAAPNVPVYWGLIHTTHDPTTLQRTTGQTAASGAHYSSLTPQVADCPYDPLFPPPCGGLYGVALGGRTVEPYHPGSADLIFQYTVTESLLAFRDPVHFHSHSWKTVEGSPFELTWALPLGESSWASVDVSLVPGGGEVDFVPSWQGPSFHGTAGSLSTRGWIIQAGTYAVETVATAESGAVYEDGGTVEVIPSYVEVRVNPSLSEVQWYAPDVPGLEGEWTEIGAPVVAPAGVEVAFRMQGVTIFEYGCRGPWQAGMVDSPLLEIVDWGDGSPQGTSTALNGLAGDPLVATHIYPAADIHEVTITFSNPCGRSDDLVFAVEVVEP